MFMLGVFFFLGIGNVYLEFVGLIVICRWLFDLVLGNYEGDYVNMSQVVCDNLFLVVVVMFKNGFVWRFFIIRDFN